MIREQNNKIDTPEKEREAASRLRIAKQAPNNQQVNNNAELLLIDDDFDSNEFNKPKTNLSEKEIEWMRKMNLVRRSARIIEMPLRYSGHSDWADVFGDIGDIAEAGEEGSKAVPGDVRRVGSNLAGSQASKIAQKKRGLSGGKSAALGGALSRALQGEGAIGIAKGALSWYLLYIAFGSLFTLAGSIPALLYLDFHYIMSKFGSKTFGKMFLWQELVLLFANIFVLFVILAAITIIVLIIDPCILTSSIGAWWGGLLGKTCNLLIK